MISDGQNVELQQLQITEMVGRRSFQGYISKKQMFEKAGSYCVQVFFFEGKEWLTKGQELVHTFPVPDFLTNILRTFLAPW